MLGEYCKDEIERNMSSEQIQSTIYICQVCSECTGPSSDTGYLKAQDQPFIYGHCACASTAPSQSYNGALAL